MLTIAIPPSPASEPGPAGHRATLWDRLAVLLLGATGCVLSYDALRQMAFAIHVRPTLTWLFPVVIDGFIAYGVRALLVLHRAPFRARLYAWTLFSTATAASIWANALHAVRLNELPNPADELHLGDTVVGILSTLAPLALAGATHLYILVTRHNGQAPQPRREEAAVDRAPVDGEPESKTYPQPVRRDEGVDEDQLTKQEAGLALVPTTYADQARGLGDFADWTELPADTPNSEHRDEDSSVRRTVGRPPSAPIDTLEAIAWAGVEQAGKLTRAVVEQAVRDAGHTISATRLTDLMDRLRSRTSA